MNWFKRLFAFLVGFAAVLGLVFVFGSAYGWERVWSSFYGSPDQGDVLFAQLVKTPRPNQALVCSPDICKQEKADVESPVYAASASDLRNRLLEELEAEKDLTRVDDNASMSKLRFVQRTATMRFPDTIRVEFFPLDGNRATMALYSSSQIGYGDYGVNLNRAKRWLSYLTEIEAAKQ